MARNTRRIRIDPFLDNVIKDVKRNMESTRGKASFMEAQRETAFRFKTNGLIDTRTRKKKKGGMLLNDPFMRI